MNLLKERARDLLSLWAKLGVAPGYLHSVIDQYAHKLYTGPLTRKTIGGGRVVCDIRDEVQSRIFFFGAYEPIELHLFCDLIEPDMTVLDVGANIGIYSIVASSYLKNGTIFCFEPVAKNFQCLQKNRQLSDRSNMEVRNFGLWNQKETLSFRLPAHIDRNLGSYTVGDVDSDGTDVICDVDTLDNFVANESIKAIDLVKMDIEGAELNALKGGLNALEKFQPSILMEINREACEGLGYLPVEIEKILLPLGYKIFRVESLSKNSGFIESVAELQQSNVFFLNARDAEKFQTQWDYKAVKSQFINV